MFGAYQSTRWTGQKLDNVYPVGSIYISTVSTDPGELFGGTWTAIENVFLKASDGVETSGTTGGYNNHTHTTIAKTTGGHSVTIAEMPAHTHGQYTGTGTGTIRDLNTPDHNTLMGTNGLFWRTQSTWSGSHGAGVVASKNPCYYNRLNVNATHTHTSVGSGTAHSHSQVSVSTSAVSNLPPYKVVYMWQRTE